MISNNIKNYYREAFEVADYESTKFSSWISKLLYNNTYDLTVFLQTNIYSNHEENERNSKSKTLAINIHL